ncbi:MAG: CBS domain-containing protein [Promethearchaeota archaeon]
MLEFLENLSSKLKTLRRAAGLTQTELAKIAGVSQSLIARIEKGGIDPRASTLEKIIRAIYFAKEPEQKISEFATKNVIKINSKEKLSKAASLMSEMAISQLIIIDDKNTIIGSIREKSLTQNLLEKGTSILDEEIENYLDDPFPEISISTHLEEIKSLLLDNDALILIDKGKLSGIVTKADIIKFYKS